MREFTVTYDNPRPTLFRVVSNTDGALAWLKNHIGEESTWLDNVLLVESGYLENLLSEMRLAGFRVEAKQI